MEAAEQARMAALYRAGRRDGLAIAALVIGLTSGFPLLGFEKAVTAIVLGAVAARQAPRQSLAWNLGVVAAIIGIVFIVTLVIVALVFRLDLAALIPFISALQKLS